VPEPGRPGEKCSRLLFAGIEADRDGLDVALYLPVLRSRECRRPVSGPG
jgi:hypothetical protein